MNKYLLYLLNAILVLSVMSCREENFGPDTDDDYEGKARELVLHKEARGFNISAIKCAILAPDGNVIYREGTHTRSGETSKVKFNRGLADGVYRLLYFEFDRPKTAEYETLPDKFTTAQFGLGSKIEVRGSSISVTDSFDEGIGLPGSGTKEDPYIISSYKNVIKLMLYVNNAETNGNIKEDTYFLQTNSINMDQACFECDMRYGWLPIGNDTNTPFRGVYQGAEMSWLWIDRPNSAGVGLFGYVHNATITGVKLTHAEVNGNFAVGALVGACISAGDSHGRSRIADCSSSGGKITGSEGAVNVGGLVGALDMYSSTLIARCVNDGGSVKASYNAGGIVGGAGIYSRADILGCRNSTPVSGKYAGTGGIIGTADTLYMVAAYNSGDISGATGYAAGDKNNSSYGTGGLAGGTGMAWISAAANYGKVTGYDGVGGISGSSRIKGSDTESTVLNNVYYRWTSNQGDVSGHDYVGGIGGECQFGSYAASNTGNVEGNDFVGGIVGNTSICVAHNAVNAGAVKGASHVAGIVGKATWGSLAFSHNMGDVEGRGHHVAGVLGLAGNNTMVHSCGNFGAVSNSGEGPTAGLIAEIGDPREWTGAQIADCVIGAMEAVLAVAGPVLGIVKPFAEAAHETLMTALEVTEFTTHWLVAAVDVGMFGYVMHEILNPEMAEELKHDMEGEVTAHIDSMTQHMEKLRDSSKGIVGNSFSKEPLANYFAGVKSNLQQYELEGNDEKFNDAMNEARAERMEEMEKQHESSELAHQIVSGICLVLGTVAAIGSFVATGGAAAAFVVTGSVIAATSSANAISKACMEFEENVVLIDQCVNAGSVRGSSGRIAGLVAVLQDNSIMSDCLNTGQGFGGGGQQLVDKANPASMAVKCLAMGYGFGDTPVDMNHTDRSVVYTENEYFVADRLQWGVELIPLSRKEIGDAEIMSKGFRYLGKYVSSPDFEIGEGKRWIMGGGSSPFPVPNKSIYLK